MKQWFGFKTVLMGMAFGFFATGAYAGTMTNPSGGGGKATIADNPMYSGQGGVGDSPLYQNNSTQQSGGDAPDMIIVESCVPSGGMPCPPGAPAAASFQETQPATGFPAQ